MDERIWIEATTLGDLVDREGARRHDKEALVFPDVRVSYGELSALSDRFARALRALGVGPEDKVGILMPNCLDFVLAVVATAKLGAIAVPINGRFRTHELSQITPTCASWSPRRARRAPSTTPT
jgi:fatty-acyl-CoA synthase